METPGRKVPTRDPLNLDCKYQGLGFLSTQAALVSMNKNKTCKRKSSKGGKTRCFPQRGPDCKSQRVYWKTCGGRHMMKKSRV